MELTEMPSKPRGGAYEAVDTYDDEGLDSSVRPRPAPKPRSWRRIGLIIITGLILLGVPLFIWLQVQSARTCVWADWEKPEFLPDDVHLIPISENIVGVFWSLTNSRDKVCKKLWLEQAAETEYSPRLFYQVFTFDGTSGNWSGAEVRDLSNHTVLTNTTYGYRNVFITAQAKLSSRAFVILTQSYDDTWGLYRIDSPTVAKEVDFFPVWTSKQGDLQIYDLVQFADGSTYLMNESAADQVPQPSLSITPVTATGLDRANQVDVSISQLNRETDPNRAVYWWTVGTAGVDFVKQIYLGYSVYGNGTEQFFFSLCSLGPDANNKTKIACSDAPWNTSPVHKQLLLIDRSPEGVTRYLVNDQDPNHVGASSCQWFVLADGFKPASEPWAAEYCQSLGKMRRTGNTAWLRADPNKRNITTYPFSPGLVDKFLDPHLPREPAPIGESGLEMMAIFTPEAVPNIPSPVEYPSTFMVVLLNPRFYSRSNVLYYYKRYPIKDEDFDFDDSVAKIQGSAAPPPNVRNE